MPDYELAQINVARLIAPIDDPRIAEFVAQLAPVNRLADQSPGFIWRLQSENGNATEISYDDDPFIIVNMSVWESVEALQAFTYRSRHLEVLRDRKKWFSEHEGPHYCLWWVPQGHRPTVAEGRHRLSLYADLGPSEQSFWFGDPFPMPKLEPALR